MSNYTNTGIFATLPRTTRGKPVVIGKDPKGKNFLYCNGQSVIIRDIENPAICDVYTEHSKPCFVAQYSPSGFYIASGDAQGKVRIWDTVNKEHILKNEFQPISGQVKDIAWTGDSQRICAVGEGREKFGHVFSWDSGTSVGEIMGQSGAINSCDFRKDRPMRVVTASEDNSLAFFAGPPFKFQSTLTDHKNFVNCVRYHPKGDVFISGGADGKSFIYDGKTAELKGELGSPAHKGGVYGICFNDDGSKLLTVSADKSCKIWDWAAGTCDVVFEMGKDLNDMQVGCLWQGNHIISISLSGNINYLDINNPATPLRVVHGHNKPITALAISEDKTTAFTGASDGGICSWDLATGTTQPITGGGHKNQVQDMVAVGDELISCGMDDTVSYASVSGKGFINSVGMASQPQAVSAVQGGLAIVACLNEVVVLRNGKQVYSEKISYGGKAVAIRPDLSEVAVGGADSKVYIYSLSGDTLSDSGRVLEISQGEINDLKYSPDGAYLAAADANRKVVLYTTASYEPTSRSGYSLHTARVNSLSWSPDSSRLLTTSLDTNVYAWSVTDLMNPIKIRGAHPMTNVTGAAWIDNNRCISVGQQDCCIRHWSFQE